MVGKNILLQASNILLSLIQLRRVILATRWMSSQVDLHKKLDVYCSKKGRNIIFWVKWRLTIKLYLISNPINYSILPGLQPFPYTPQQFLFISSKLRKPLHTSASCSLENQVLLMKEPEAEEPRKLRVTSRHILNH